MTRTRTSSAPDNRLSFPATSLTAPPRWDVVRRAVDEAILRSHRSRRVQPSWRHIQAVLDWLWWRPCLDGELEFHWSAVTVSQALRIPMDVLRSTTPLLMRAGVIRRDDTTRLGDAFIGEPCVARALVAETPLVERILNSDAAGRTAQLLATTRAMLVAGTIERRPTREGLAIDLTWDGLARAHELTRRAIEPHLAMLEHIGVVQRDTSRPSPPAPLRFVLAAALTRREAVRLETGPGATPTPDTTASTAPRLVVHPDGRQEMIAPEWTPAQFAEYARSLNK